VCVALTEVNTSTVDDTVWLNVGLVVFFILLGGLFAAAELALVSLRESQLDALEKRSRRGAAVAQLARDPNTFLAAVQIGVTVSGFFSAAFGATALAPVLEGPLRAAGINPVAAGVVAVIAMTLLVAYASLVFGELAPKRLALQKAEGFALAIAPLIAWIAVAFTPLIWLVGKSSDAVVKLLGGDPNKRGEVLSGEELKSIVESHESLGDEQREILSDVLEAAEQALISVMQPRGDVHCLVSTMAITEARELLQSLPYSRYPVITKSLDDCESFVHVRDVMWASKTHQTIADVARSIPILPSSMSHPRRPRRRTHWRGLRRTRPRRPTRTRRHTDPSGSLPRRDQHPPVRGTHRGGDTPRALHHHCRLYALRVGTHSRAGRRRHYR